MSDEKNETKELPTRLYMTIGEMVDRKTGSPRAPEVVLIQATSRDHCETQACQMTAQGWALGAFVEVPLHARGMVHAVIEAAFVDEPEHGKPLFAEVRESRDGFHARLLTQQRSRMLGWADEVAIMGGGHDDVAGTPGEALGALALGLDRVLAVEGWRESFGRLPRPVRKADDDT